MDDYFSKLPNRLFLNDEENKSYLNIIKDDKVIKILDYLYTGTNREGNILVILEDLIDKCGYKLNSNKGRTNDIFKNVLIKLKEINIIDTGFDLNELKKGSYFYCKLNMFNKNKNDEDINFIQLFKYEKELILNYNKIKIDNLTLLKLYCYIKARIFNRKDDKDIQVVGGRSQVCYPSYAKIEEDIGISQSSTKKYVDILVELDLIRYKNAGIYYPRGNPQLKRESANTYVLYDEFDKWEVELKKSIKFFKNKKLEEGFVFCKENTYKNNNRKLNGELGALIRLNNKGKATNKQIKRIEEIRSELNEK